MSLQKSDNADLYTTLERLSVKKGVIKSTFSDIGDINLSSWLNDVLPDSIWAALIASSVPREEYLDLFRNFITNISSMKHKIPAMMPCHSWFGQLDANTFESMFAAIIRSERSLASLTPLLFLKSLPDLHHWQNILGALQDEEAAVGNLIQAVMKCYDHQSQESTDIRWLRVMTLFAQDRIVLPEELLERFYEYRDYPDRGDMRAVRPSIRALEMSTRNLEKELNTTAYNTQFWSECLERTSCVPFIPKVEKIEPDNTRMNESVLDVLRHLLFRFLETCSDTDVDARHEGSFGLTLYNLNILYSVFKANSGQTLLGRIALRTGVEVYITLKYLSKKDTLTEWLQFRNHGAGQAKLTFLKNMNKEDIPKFLDIELLERLANEDLWIELRDIHLGAWASKNLREMAIAAGIKDFYDRYYDSLSAFVHGNWMAIRQSSFTECLNPLHRFHRVPRPPGRFEQSTIIDLVKVCNLCLEEISRLYPPFKPRLQFVTAAN